MAPTPASTLRPATLLTATTTLASRANGDNWAKGNGDTFASSLSADGRFVGLSSRAANLSPDDPDTAIDVFVRELGGRS
jgi:hypothetical protein